MKRLIFYLCASVCICGSILFYGCDRDVAHHGQTVTVYTSVDQPIADFVLKAFTAKTGIQVIARYDTEAAKSVGLAERLRAEKSNPQADVWWGNEIFLTIGLADDGVLAGYESPAAADVPAKFKDVQHRWAANGMRVRVLAVQAVLQDLIRINGLEDLTNPLLNGQIVMARPVAGTTTGHVAALYTLWGEAKADAYFRALRANNIKLVGGNSMVVQGIASKQFFAGLTDNDDVDSVGGDQVWAVLPDQLAIGTLAIPCTVGLVANRPTNDAAKQLIDYLLSIEVEKKLIEAKFVKFSVRATPTDIRTMDVDYAAVAKIFPQATRRAVAILEGREP